jgi:hypothetical protein
MELIKSRPVGVSLLAALLAIQGIFEIGYGLLVLFTAPGFVALYGNIVMVRQVSPWGFLISGILALILAYGLWTLQRWAFWVTVVLETINLVGGVVVLFTVYYPGAVLLSMLIPAIILTYFFADHQVREAFGLH